MKRLLVRLFAILVFFVIGSVARAADTRRVVGGDLVLTGEGYHRDSATSAYLGEMEAINRVAAECGVVPKNTTIWEKVTKRQDGEFYTVVKAGLPISECQEAARLKGKAQKAQEHPILADEHRKYLKARYSDDDGQALKSYLEKKFGEVITQGKKTENRVGALEEKVSELQKPQPPQIQVVKTTEVVIRGPAAERKACLQKVERLEMAAIQASQYNYPRGNMATGAAAEYMNAAQMKMQECNNLTE